MRTLVQLLPLTLLAALLVLPAQAQLPTSKLDDFARPDSNILGNTPTEPTSIQWAEKGQEVGSETSLTSGETIRIENETAVLQSGAKNGQKWAALDMSNVDGYPTTLDDASGVVTWAFNMRQNRSNPEGFSAGEHGLMYVLAASGNDFPGSANAYAVVVGQDGASDALKLVSFNGGFGKEGDFQEIASWSTDIGTEYLSVRVTFDADDKTWTLFAEKASGSYPRSDPRTVPASAERDSAQNSDLTGDGQKFTGILWNHGQDDTARAVFDDLYVTDPNGALPVELAQFEATADGRDVRLRWTTASETENAGFEVQRGTEEGFETLGFVEGAGTTTQPTRYSFTVEGLSPGTHAFRLKQVDLDGSTSLSPERVVEIQPEGLQLVATGPNPVETGERASFRLLADTGQNVTVTVHDVLGRTVRTLYEGRVGAQSRELTMPVSSLSNGLYFVRVQGPSATATQRITVVR